MYLEKLHVISSIREGSSSLRKKNTSNLWTHLKINHKDAYNEVHEKAEVAKKGSASSSQPTLQQVFDRTTKWTPNDPRSIEMDMQLWRALVLKDYWPRQSPDTYLKVRSISTLNWMEEIHTKVVRKIKQLLKVENARNSIAFTTDCWSGSTEALMSSFHWQEL